MRQGIDAPGTADLNGRDTPHSRGHLNPRATPPLARYAPPAPLADLIRQFWIPEWQLPRGKRIVARVLGYPALNLVVEGTTVVIVGPTRRASERVLEGEGWAVGALLRPAAAITLGLDASELLDTVLPLDAPALAREVAAAMATRAEAGVRHREAMEAFGRWLMRGGAVQSPAGRLSNAAMERLETDPEHVRVAGLASELGVSTRTLQRALLSTCGLSPGEILRRFRLQRATEQVRDSELRLGDVAQDVGYADQAHMAREFRAQLRSSPRDFRTIARESAEAPGHDESRNAAGAEPPRKIGE